MPLFGIAMDVDNLCIGQLAFDVLDTTLDKALLLFGGMILGVFLEIAVRPGFGDRLDDSSADLRF